MPIVMVKCERCSRDSQYHCKHGDYCKRHRPHPFGGCK